VVAVVAFHPPANRLGAVGDEHQFHVVVAPAEDGVGGLCQRVVPRRFVRADDDGHLHGESSRPIGDMVCAFPVICGMARSRHDTQNPAKRAVGVSIHEKAYACFVAPS